MLAEMNADELIPVYQRQPLKLHEWSVSRPSELQIIQRDLLDRLTRCPAHTVLHAGTLHRTCPHESARNMYHNLPTLLKRHNPGAESAAVTKSLHSELNDHGGIRAVQEVCCERVNGEVWSHRLVCCVGAESHEEAAGNDVGTVPRPWELGRFVDVLDD